MFDKKIIIDSANALKLDDIEERWDGAIQLDSNPIDASNVLAIDRNPFRTYRTIDEWLKIYPFIKLTDDSNAKCELCGGVFKTTRGFGTVKQHILSGRHRPFAIKIYASYQKIRCEILEKKYPFIKTVKNKYGVVRCDFCGGRFNIGTRNMTTSIKIHTATKKHKHSQAVIEKYPFVKNYPFIGNASSIDIVRCKWCRTDFNISRHGDLAIVQHCRTRKHAKVAEQYNSSTGNSLHFSLHDFLWLLSFTYSSALILYP